jgi:hypothetical protein
MPRISIETLLRLVETVSTVRAIKDWCNVVPQHERHIRKISSLPRRLTVHVEFSREQPEFGLPGGHGG